jgi:hypothetical protein
MLHCLSGSVGRPLESNGETQRDTPRHAGATGAVRSRPERPSVIHSSLYLPEPVYEALRKIAFDERLKINDVVLEGIDAALRRRGYPSVENLKAGKKR